MLLLATSVFSQRPPDEDQIPVGDGPIVVVADEAEVLVIVNSEVVTTLQTDVTTLQDDVMKLQTEVVSKLWDDVTKLQTEVVPELRDRSE